MVLTRALTVFVALAAFASSALAQQDMIKLAERLNRKAMVDYDALEFDGCNGPYAFGAEGSVALTELSTRTMETPPEEIALVA